MKAKRLRGGEGEEVEKWQYLVAMCVWDLGGIKHGLTDPVAGVHVDTPESIEKAMEILEDYARDPETGKEEFNLIRPGESWREYLDCLGRLWQEQVANEPPYYETPKEKLKAHELLVPAVMKRNAMDSYLVISVLRGSGERPGAPHISGITTRGNPKEVGIGLAHWIQDEPDRKEVEDFVKALKHGIHCGEHGLCPVCGKPVKECSDLVS